MEMEGSFEFAETLLRLSGILKAEGRHRWLYRLCEVVIWSSLCWVWLPLGLGAARHMGSDYVAVMEALLYAKGFVHVMSKLLVLRLRRSRLIALIRRLEVLTAQAISRNPEEGQVFARGKRFASYVPKGFLAFCCLVLLVSLLGGLYTGTPPYRSMWSPTDEVAGACLYQLMTLFPGSYVAIPYGLLSALTAGVSTHIVSLSNRLASLRRSDHFTEELTAHIVLHNQIMRVVEDMNYIFGAILFQEILLSSFQYCLAAYLCTQQIKGLTEGNKVYCAQFVMTTLMPLLICSCGERIKAMSSKIPFSVYSSPWYYQSFEDKKRIRIMMTVASRPLKLHYKNLICFDFVQYLVVLQTAYSYFAVLQSLEK